MNVNLIKENCTGCGCCINICPKKCIIFKKNEEGFLYPFIDENKCIDCSLCFNRCPINNPLKNVISKCIIARVKDEEELINSASGGISNLLAEAFLKIGGIVFGAAYNDKLEVEHIKIDKLTDLYKIRSSKYVQSNLKETFLEINKLLEKDIKVLFIGTPCQVHGLKKFLNKEYCNLLTADLICHGVPSPLLFQHYIKWEERILKETITSINFRDKTKKGWSNTYYVKITTKTKTKIVKFKKNLYGYDFIHANNYRESCYRCKYSNLNRVGDITLGDCWGIKKKDEIYSKNGVSLVLINTQNGEEIFKSIENQCVYRIDSLGEYLNFQTNFYHPTNRPKQRNDYYKNIDTDFFENKKIPFFEIKKIKQICPKFIKKIIKKIMR